jgi:hypothetical protein
MANPAWSGLRSRIGFDTLQNGIGESGDDNHRAAD